MSDRRTMHDDHHPSGDRHHHHGHSHNAIGGHAHGANERRMTIAAILTGAFMLAEVVGGLWSGSLALLADAGHMLTDFAALGLGVIAFRLTRKPRDDRRTYGYDRFEVLVAFVNGLALFAIAALIVYEAWHRLEQPAAILGGPMLAIAGAGLLVNVAVFFVLHGGDRENLNMRGALLHVMGDLLGSVAALAAALVILLTGWTPIDPILSVLVALLLLASAYRLVRDAGQVLLEGAPTDLAVEAVAPHLTRQVAGLREVHHLHAWTITPERKMATLHACLEEDSDAMAVTRAIKAEMREAFGIGHTTVEIEYGICADEAEDGCGHREHAHHPHDHAGHTHSDHHAHAAPV
ncbi:cation diffusion facilitator family transporter [Aurantimonas sp. MSK8Z-1]|uniref:cation diffusion facilitator family transporter n=1 Tax=Mangrovibrevibacter kandeliae TaxID=2968473 RepID=UPI0021183FE8|nr:cation diffusion facilitator family transporter [Aurantimonas sp. MSK8Z-1]MCW4115983.1 cation diffusion facilitator family transporter [Aurantimonas sp. MSK8Z-1]